VTEKPLPSVAQRESHTNPFGRLRKHWNIFAPLLLMLVSFPPALLSPHKLVIFRHPSLIDDSWLLDTSFKASRGIWFGRDVVFTYGPLFQWLESAPSRWMGPLMGSIHATYNMLPLWCTIVLGYFTLRLLIPEQPAWKRFLLLLLLLVYWTPSDLRTAFAILKTSLPLFLFALFMKGWYAIQRARLTPWSAGAGAAALCAVAFLYSADAGVYAIAALAVSSGAIVWEFRRQPRLLRQCGSVLCTSAAVAVVLVIAINAIMARPFDFRFWKGSLAIVAAYRWLEPAEMAGADQLRLLVAWTAGCLVFLLRRVISDDREASIVSRSGFLLGGFVFALLFMLGGLVRPDSGHITLAIFPMVFFAGIVLFSFPSPVASVIAALVAVVTSLMLAGQPYPPPLLRSYYTQQRDLVGACPLGALPFDGACLVSGFATDLEIVARHLQRSSKPTDSLVIFPYETIFGIASQRNVAGGVMQSYLVSGPYLSRLQISGLERASAPVGLYLPDADANLGTDRDASFAVDGVPNFTRSPEVWFWILRHYRSEQQPLPGIFQLQRDDSRASRIVMQAQALNLAAHSFPIATRSSVLDLGDPAWPGAGGDFLKLRLTVRYKFWWKLRKPSRLQLEITRADGSSDLKAFILEPNAPSEIWFFPWSDADLPSYFETDETHWRSSPRPAITRLRLLATPFDWVSQQPYSIVVDSVDAVWLNMALKP
jgi:hypothetical protein